MNPPNLSEKIKEAVTLRAWLQKQNIDVFNVGDETYNAAACPLCGHHDCFRFSTDKELWKCFSCEVGGDVIELHKRFMKCDYKQAVAELANDFNVEIDNLTRAASGAKKIDQKKRQILEAALAHYQKAGAKAGPMLRYLASRRYNQETVDRFGLGWADGKLYQNLKAKFSESELIDSGLIRKNEKGKGKVYDFFRRQVIFPYFDTDNKVVHLKGKGIDGSGNSNGKTYQLPLKGKEQRPLFGRHIKLKADDPLFICEGETDAIALNQAGKKAWGLGGNPSDKQLTGIHQLLDQGRHVIFVFDNDAGGFNYEVRFREEFIRFRWPKAMMTVFRRNGRISKAVFPNKYKDIDAALRDNAFENVVTLKPMIPDLNKCLKVYNEFVQAEELRYSADVVGKIIYEYLDCHGLFFVVNEDCYLIYNNNQYLIDNNMPFKALIYEKAGINYASQSSKVVWESIKAQCFLRAQHTSEAAWIHTDHEACRIHYNLCNDQNELVCIEPGKVRLVSNGSNENNIFLFPSPKTAPITFMEEVDMEKGLEALFECMSFLATSEKWKFYIIGLILNTFIIEFAKARGINKFTGHQGSGKTDAAGLITALLYGQNFVTISSTASDYTDAALNPFTICDNLEISNLDDERKNFLLCVATGITRQKRKSGTDTKNVYEKAITQVITTSIESFEVPELIERAIIVPFDSKFFIREFPGSVVIEKKLIAKRDLIINSLFRLVSNLLTDFNAMKTGINSFIQSHYPNHAKKRLNEHLACIALAVDAFIEHCPSARRVYGDVQQLLAEWINEQDEENEEVMQETNVIVRYLDMLAEEWRRDNLEMYNLEPLTIQSVKINLEFEASNALLLSAFQLLAKKYNFGQKFKSVRHLAVRIRNERSIIEKAGWSIFKSRTVRGQRYFKFIQAS